jgi:anti-sigma regulatory factor (Ser/Thr protein kinase)
MERKYFPGTVDSLDSLREYVGELAERAGLAKKQVYSLKLAIDEIATNIILYGYEAAGIKAAYSLTSEITEHELILTLEDEAAEFNPLNREMPTEEDLLQELDGREIGGLGIFLTINGVDEFTHEYRDGRNRNRFVMKTEKS